MWTLLRYLSQTVVGSREPKLSRGEPHLTVPLEFTLGASALRARQAGVLAAETLVGLSPWSTGEDGRALGNGQR